MKVSKYFKFILGLLIGCVGICTASLTAAWFTYTAQIKGKENELIGSSEGAYYARGRGTPEDPFIINKPRHLYNLAWLQYLGRYNKVDEKTGKVNQTYFAIDPRKDESDTTNYSNWYLDMSGEVLPPIGTETYPFLGNFDGRGYTIKNLTTSNEYGTADGDVKKKPAMVNLTNDQLKGVNIVGTFGVVGDIDGTYKGKYDSSVLSVSNFKIDGSTVHNKLNDTLIGVLAGYVNGEVEDVLVSDSKVDLENTNSSNNYGSYDNISKYTTVGYCTPDYEQKVKKEVATIYKGKEEGLDPFTLSADGEDTGLGGSVDFLKVYNGLKYDWDSMKYSTDTIKYISAVEHDLDENGQEKEGFPKYTYTNTPKFLNYNAGSTKQSGYLRFFENSDGTTYKDENGIEHYGQTSNIIRNISYSYAATDNNTLTTSTTTTGDNWEKRWMTLSGRQTRELSSGRLADNTNRYTNTETHYYYDGEIYNISWTYNNKVYYVVPDFSNNKLSSSLNSADWYIVDNNLACINAESFYYVVFDGSTLSLNTVPSTQCVWSINGSSLVCRYNEVNYILKFYEDKFFLTQKNNETFYRLRYKFGNGNNDYYYFKFYNNTLSSTSDINEALLFNNAGTPVSFIDNGITYYLGSSDDDEDNILVKSTNTYTYGLSNSYLFRTYYYSSLFYRTTYYFDVYLSNTAVLVNSQTRSHNSNYKKWSSQSVTKNYSPVTINQVGKITKLRVTKRENEVAKVTFGDTYFPLRTTTKKVNGEDIRTGVPDKNNTGYIVSGANFTTGNLRGDIRISAFPGPGQGQIAMDGNEVSSGSYIGRAGGTGGGDLTNIYTIADNNRGVNTIYKITDNSGNLTTNYNNEYFSEFNTARDYLRDNVVKDADFVYGIHFMNAKIGYEYSDGYRIKIPYAIINRKEYFNYEVPYDAVNFNLGEKGYINFLASNFYYNTENDSNNSFFSLFKVYRDGNNSITDIKKITEIYAAKTQEDRESYSFVYKLGEGNSALYTYPYKYSADGKTRVKLDNSTFNDNETTSTQPNTTIFDYNNPVFKTKWIERTDSLRTSTNLYNVFFFQIPMNEGEFALGSVDGATGAYLLYLDIGANALKVNRTKVHEYFTIVENTYSFPKGVSVLISGASSNGDKNSYCVLIRDSFNGTVSLEENGGTSDGIGKVSKTGSVGNAYISYCPDDLDVKINSTLTVATPLKAVKKEIRRLTLLDYNTGTRTLTSKVIISEDKENTIVNDYETVSEVNNFGNRVIEKYNPSSDTPNVSDPTMYVYNDRGKRINDYNTALTNTYDPDLTKAYTLDETVCKVNGNYVKNFEFTNVFVDGGIVTVSFVTSFDSYHTTEATYYNINGYDINVSFAKDSESTATDITDLVSITYNGLNNYVVTFNPALTGGSTKPTLALDESIKIIIRLPS